MHALKHALTILSLSALALIGSVSLIFAADTTVALSPIIDAVQPIVVSLLVTLLGALLTFLANKLNTYFNIQISAQNREALQRAIEAAAGNVWAKAKPGIENMSIDVKSQMVADGVNYVVKSVPDTLKTFGIDADKSSQLAEMVVARIGFLQAASPASTPVENVAPVENAAPVADLEPKPNPAV